jgi:hypothetical protein
MESTCRQLVETEFKIITQHGTSITMCPTYMKAHIYMVLKNILYFFNLYMYIY